MADTSVGVTPGSGADIDTRTESTNGNHRQVVVIGDPTTNAGVAPVDATNGLKVNVGSSTLPTGAATSAKQDTGNTSLSSIDTKLTDNATQTTLATRLSESDFDTKVGSLTETAPASDTASSGLNGRLQRLAQRITSLIALLPASLGQKTKTNSLAVTLASDQDALPITDNGGSVTVDGTVAATQSGTWTVQPGNTANTTAWKVDGSAVTQPISAASLPLPSTAATSTKQSDGSQKSQIVDGSGNVVTVTGNKLDVNATASLSGSSVPISGASTAVGVAIVDNSGNQINSFGGGTQYAEGDDISTGVPPTGTVTMTRNDNDDTAYPIKSHVGSIFVEQINNSVDVRTTDFLDIKLLSTTNPGVRADVNISNELLVKHTDAIDVNLQAGNGTDITQTGGALDVNIASGSSSGTQYAELNTTSPATGTVALGRYLSSPPGTLTDGQLSAPLMDGYGQLKVVPVGTVTVQDGGGSLTVDNGGTFAVQAAQSGTWNVTNISGTVSLPTGAATAAKQPALGTAGTSSSDVITVQGRASMTPLLTDASATTQPISAASLPLPSGAATSAKQDTGNTSVASIDTKTPALGQALAAASVPIVLTAAQITTLTPPAAITGFSTSTKQSDGSQKTQVVDGSGNVIGSTSNALDVNIKTNVTQASTVSSNNSSTAVLAGGAVFTGTADDCLAYSEVRITVIASHASATDGLSIQQSSDSTNWDITDTYTIAATTGKTYVIPRQARYMRVVYTNGATLQTSFRLQTILNRTGTVASSQRASDAYTNETDLQEMWSFNSVWNSAAWDRVRSIINATNSVGTGIVAAGMVAQFDDVSPTAITENQFGNARMSANRNLYNTIRDAAGNERGANVSAGNALLVDASATTQPVSYATTGSGTATGALRVEVANNGTGVIGLNTGTNSIGKISDITTSVVPGTAATNLGKAEDAAHTTGDTGVFTLGVRNDTLADVTNTTADYSQYSTDIKGRLITAGAPRSLKGNAQVQLSNTTTETTILAATASTFHDVYGIILANTGASTTKVSLRDDTAGTVRAIIEVPTLETRGFMLPVDSAINQTAVNKNWTAQCGTATTALEVTVFYVSMV